MLTKVLHDKHFFYRSIVDVLESSVRKSHCDKCVCDKQNIHNYIHGN